MAKKKKSNTGAKVFFLGAALGAVGGVIAGLLTAPKSGKSTRSDLSKAGKKATKEASKQIKKVTSGRNQKTATKTSK